MKTTSAHQNDRKLSLIFLFAATLFTSATLMFVLQPMFGKILLPLLGGSPSVWNTCMVFYQSILFLGYLYAHYLSTALDRQRQILVHAGIILLSLLVLPLALPDNASPPTESNPTWWLLWVLLLAIGLPFFVVSTTAPLLQKWFSQVGHHTSHDPYYLYTASNAGSLLALLSYPFLIEPHIGLENQKFLWSAGYILLGLLIAGCAWIFWRSGNHTVLHDQESQLPAVDSLDIRTRLHWLALAFVPSSLLLGLTNFISTDIASVPLLWIIPLTLYLLSFIIVFSKWNGKTHPWMVKLQPVVLLPFIAYSFIDPAIVPYWLDLVLHLLAFFLAIMVCHGELAKMRPHTRHLTLYYLIMSFAGMLGGMFNTFLAPFIFNGVYEYPIMIIAALLLRPNLKATHKPAWKQLLLDAGFPAALFILGFSIYLFTDSNALGRQLGAIVAALTLLAGLNYAFRFRAVTLALTTAVIILFSFVLHNLRTSTLFQERTFFGVLSVRKSVLIDEQNQPEIYHELFHGTTKHGAQRLPAGLQTIPLTYYSQPGPMGQLFKAYDPDNALWRIGVVGLGAGALACYSKPGQDWVFYEIDPAVVKIAENTDYFSYLEHCAKKYRMRIGDARLSLQNDPEQYFDLLVLDAFSSDAVPTHLLTRQALELYFAKLKPTGILAFHITNRHLALKKVLSDHARNLGLAALIQEFEPQQQIPLVVATDWVVMARHEQTLQRLQESRLGHWQKLPLYFDMRSWTDDFTNIVSVWR
ncbi:spermidine synthase [Thiolapillus sp.]|uniref:spermidine synthase n=1 Tax=Thiolapillus sp. TaxID=2017437 RepID=UPI003AF57A71